jgi:hypothetical protein
VWARAEKGENPGQKKSDNLECENKAVKLVKLNGGVQESV